MSDNGQKFSLWQLLEGYQVIIPLLQRDYAQGRADKHYLRANFLQALLHALESNTELTLDFIYGEEHEQKLELLDGQQRFTTLWLLHWYLVFKSGLLSQKMQASLIGQRLNKFSYQVRQSATDFLQQLCKAENFNDLDLYDKPVRAWLEDRPWFDTAWRQDPTIQSILTMLGGNTASQKYGQTDNLEALFKDKGSKLSTFWERLTSSHSPITFYYLPLTNFNLSDDLYIKMNSRGKALNAYENFKADLIGYIQQQQNQHPSDEWQELAQRMPQALDTCLLDLFWQADAGAEGLEEAIFFFINNYFFIDRLLAKGADNHYLVDLSGSNNNIKHPDLAPYRSGLYNSLKDYQYYSDPNGNSGIDPQMLLTLLNIFDNYREYLELVCAKQTPPIALRGEKFTFIPRYNKDFMQNNESNLSLRELALFFALCYFFKFKSEADTQVALQRWLRVCFNVIDTEDAEGHLQLASVNTLRSILNELKKVANPHDVYKSLQPSSSSGYLGTVLNEEYLKAQQIIHPQGAAPDVDWESKIIAAEQTAFFHGGISFLYHNADGEVDWSNFDSKLDKAKQYFAYPAKDGDYGGTAPLLRYLINLCDGPCFGEVFFNRALPLFAAKPSVWNYLLQHPLLRRPVDEFLTCQKIELHEVQQQRYTNNDKDNENLYYALKALCNTELIEYLTAKLPAARLNYRYIYDNECHYRLCLYRKHAREGIFVDKRAHERAQILKDETITIDKAARVDEKGLMLFGRDVHFSYQNKGFCWDIHDRIYRKEGGQELATTDQTRGKLTYDKDSGVYTADGISFSVKDPQGFKQLLNTLIAQETTASDSA